MSAPRALYWSVRRELWEHRWSVGIPLGLDVLLVLVLAAVGSRHGASEVSALYDYATRIMLIAAAIASLMYCAEALHGERRDGSILFWKALPVSDALVVASKLAVVVVVLPLVTAAFLLLALGVAHAMVASGGALRGPLTQPLAAVLEVVAATLAQAPNYSWFLLVSCWAKRAVLLWALLLVALATEIAEGLTGNDTITEAMFRRGVGRHWPSAAGLPFAASGDGMVVTPAPQLLATPSLWAGVAFALLLLVLTVQLRRRQLPVG